MSAAQSELDPVVISNSLWREVVDHLRLAAVRGHVSELYVSDVNLPEGFAQLATHRRAQAAEVESDG